MKSTLALQRPPWTANYTTQTQRIPYTSEFQRSDDFIFQTMNSGDINTRYMKLIETIGKPDFAHRQELAEQFRQAHEGRSLKDELLKVLPESEIVTNNLLIALLDTPAEHDAKYLHKAMKGLGTNEDMLIEVLVTRSNQQLRDIISAYRTLFNRELKDDIVGDTSGTFRKLLLDLLEANRDESFTTDLTQAQMDAEALYKAGEGKWGTNDAAFVKIMANQNLSQLQLMFNEYEKKTGHSFEKALKKEFSGDQLRAFLAIASFVRNGPLGAEVELLHNCIKHGAKDEQLVHLIASFMSYDTLGFILDEYKRRFKIPLEQDIEQSGKPSVLKNALIYLIKCYQ